MSRLARFLNGAILALVSAIGLAAFVYPFVRPAGSAGGGPNAMAHAQDAPFMFAALIVLCLGAVLGNLLSHGLNAKMVAALGVLSAANAVLRAVPGPVGFSAMQVLPILCGYVYGPLFGYLLGALSMTVSALLGAGIGPWLPYQMFTLGWIGLTSAWLPRLPHRPWLERTLLIVWSILWGFAFGMVMNAWFWPFVYDPAQSEIYWQQGAGIVEGFRRYLSFYALTSLWWDAGRAVGNAVLIALFGGPVLRLLRRFARRFTFETTFVEKEP
jgi:energy-coupling factor transport system substrate-specific component